MAGVAGLLTLCGFAGGLLGIMDLFHKRKEAGPPPVPEEEKRQD
jgi:hypothetical protein